ncbi:lipopolysaccharide heptosyltransferase II [Sulfidibacter corallicola]|uniref:lipopolysaccharide heptosyltransferase II n=1 Tax=Sulfidibacter corallicola TaxID=2818388 RepID=A0A8A4U1Y4_SULCO|nr:lipopolysaccharide heptosyltransferase II [Sulfidibacter corallicola]QTD52745.1 lipopolysaccharide heptosyltransferase II [Sulfidibacter corallicola]
MNVANGSVATDPSEGKGRKIAVRVSNWIGDVIMNLPGLEMLRHHYPDAEIVAIARPWVRGILSFRPDLVDRCIDFDDRGEAKSPLGFWRFARGLREERFDMAVVFTKHLKGALMMWVAGIPVRVGFGTAETRWFLNGHIMRKSLPKTGRHQSRDYLELLERAGSLAPIEPSPLPRLDLDENLARQVRETFLAGAAGPVLAVHAGAAFGTAKRWSAEGYAETCRRFLERTGGTVILLGVPAEAEVNTLIEETVADPGLRNLCGKTSLPESVALISVSDGFLSNDSGLMHVAAAFAKPQVAVFGPTDIAATFPLNERARTVYHKVDCSPCFLRDCPIGHDCMKAVTPDEVSGEVNRLFSSKSD